MNHRIGRVIAGLGGLIGLVAFFLPWIHAGTLEGLLQLLRLIAGFLGGELGDLVKDLQGYASLTGLQFVFDLPFLSTPFKILIGLPAIVSVLAWAWLLAASLGAVKGGRPLDLALALLSAAAAILLALNATTITRFGISLPVLATALSALGIKLVWGFWFSLLGLVLIAIGALVGIAGPTDDDAALSRHYGRLPEY